MQTTQPGRNMCKAYLVLSAWQQVWDAILLHFTRAGVLGHLDCIGQGGGGGGCLIHQLHLMRGNVSMHTITTDTALPLECQLGPAPATCNRLR